MTGERKSTESIAEPGQNKFGCREGGVTGKPRCGARHNITAFKNIEEMN